MSNNTALRAAFLAMPFTPVQAASQLVKKITRAVFNNSGVKRPDTKGWTAKLSFRTAMKLKADGYIA